MRTAKSPGESGRKRAQHGRHWSGRGIQSWQPRLWIASSLAGLISAVCVAGATYFVLDALAAQDAANRIQAAIEPAKAAAKDRDSTEITRVLIEVSDAAADFDQHTHGPLWDLAAKVPWVKDQVVPLMAAGEAMGELNTAVIAPLSEQDLALIESLPIKEGRIDPYLAEPFVPILRDAETVIQEQDTILQQVDLTGTVDKVSTGFVKLRDNLTDMLPGVQKANELVPMVPQLLGAGTERTYLVMVQNNAEIRATGGIGGAFIELHITDGLIEKGDYVSQADLTKGEVGTVSAEELALFGPTLVTTGQDLNYTPEFPRVAELVTAFWLRDVGRTPSAIVAIDPVALQYLLDNIEPVTANGLTMDGDNVADVLLRDSYLTFPEPAAQDVFFGTAASVIFSEILGGNVDLKGVLQAIDERRIVAWSPDDAEKDFFSLVEMDGTFLEHDNTVGIFMNDRTGAKLGYYVDAKATLVAQCAAGATTSLTATYDVALNFEGDMNAVADYVAGGFYYSDAPRGSYASYVLMYAPAGTQITGMTINGEVAEFTVLTHEGRNVVKTRIEIAPLQSVSLSYTMEGDFPEDLKPIVSPLSSPDVYTTWVDAKQLACG